MRIEMGHKFILGFIVVVAVTVLVPYGVNLLELPPWAQGIIPPLLAITVGLTIGSLFSKRLTRSMGALVEATRNLAEGDLRRAVDLGPRPVTDEVDDLAEGVNRMLGNLRQVVGHILHTSSDVAESAQNLSATAEEINASAEEISVTMEEVARGVASQKDGVERAAAQFHELDRGFTRVSETCRAAAAAARETEERAVTGSSTNREIFEHLEVVLEGLEDSARVFAEFSARIQRIHRFAEVITNLSRQTNLLALNAAIEASKAGEEGKGFSVVASEIRKLADSAEKSADQITAVLAELDDESRRVGKVVETSAQQVSGGREGLSRASASLDEIIGLVADNTQRIEEMLQLTASQAASSREVAAFVDQIGVVAESNASASQEVSVTVEHQTVAMDDMAQAAIRLSQTAEDLNRRVERFRVPEEGQGG
jgi:methyl-accepting chemotaxis protein